jgi:hypothetical protein
MIKACLILSWGCLSKNPSAKIPELTTSICWIWWTVQTSAFIDYRGFTLRVAINWSRSSLQTPAVRDTVDCWLLTSIWIYSHPTAWCFPFLLLLVLWTIFKCASRVICLVIVLVALQWTNWWLCSCCVAMIAIFDIVPANRLDWDSLTPGWGGCVSMICWCGIGEEYDNEKKWKSLRTISFGACQNSMSSSQYVRYTQDQFCWVWLQVAVVSHRPKMCNWLVWCW